MGAVLVVGASGAWLGLTGWMARGQLEIVRADVQLVKAQVLAGDLAAARRSAAQLATHAARAHHLTGGPAWAVAGRSPFVGTPFRAVHVIAAAADTLGRQTVPQLLSAGEQLDPALLRHRDGRVDLNRLTTALPMLEEASASISGMLGAVRDLPAHTYVPALDTARLDLLAQLDSVVRVAHSAVLSAKLLPPMLGQVKAKTYFLAFQNDAESRGTGGLPGAFAILRAASGKISFTRFENDESLAGVHADVRLGKDFDRLYKGAPTDLYVNGNLSPHFPYAAQIWASMWKKKSGQSVDGVLAVDPTVLSYLLGASGPAILADGTRVTAGNVVDLTQRAAYARFGDDVTARKQYLEEIAGAASAKVMAGHVDPMMLVKALGKAAGERRLLVWSADPAVQQDLAATELSGSIPETTAPYAGLSIYNEGGNKLDYYLDRSMTWTRKDCRSPSEVTVRIELTNHAPAGGLTSYATSRSDKRNYKTKPGDNRLTLNYFATAGAVMKSVTIDGGPVTAGSGFERGHPVFTVDVELPRGKTRIVILRLSEADAQGTPVVLQQPLIRPLAVKIEDAGCR